jgi:hypothetical protein
MQEVRAMLGAARESDNKADIAKFESRLARLQSDQPEPMLTVARIQAQLPRGVEFTERSHTPKLAKGESAPAALSRVREKIDALRDERKATVKAPLPLADVKSLIKTRLTTIYNNGVPKSLSVFYGGDLEMPSVKLPDHSPSINSVPDGVAFAVFMFGVDAVMERMEPFLAFNADPENALSDKERAERLAAIDAELERLGREEAALVEAVVAEGGTAYHRPDANVLHVLGLAVAA